MFKNWKVALSALVLSAGMFGAGAAFTSQANAQIYTPVPQPRFTQNPHSDRNLWWVDRRLARLVTQLQHDDYDYGGHRTNAVRYMEQARQEIKSAEAWDQQHGGTMRPY